MMTETVVHVTTLEQWKSVLDVWFGKGYEWFSSEGYREDYFRRGSRQLRLNSFNKITFSESNRYSEGYFIEYADFMKQQEKTMTKETYYVKQEKLDLITELNELSYPVYELTQSERYGEVGSGLDSTQEKALLRYIGGDKTIEFKVKETLYRLWRIDTEHDKVYMKFTKTGNPDWTIDEDRAFTAPLEEIKKWQTPAWKIEKAD